MKRLLPISLVILALIPSAIVAKPHKHADRPAQQAPPLSTPAGAQSPSARLSEFTAAHLDAILSPIDQRPALPRSELNQLRAALADDSASVPEAEREQFTTAIAVCDAINNAMDEREQTSASITGSASVHGPSDLGARRKDLPTHGGHAAARLAKIEKREERHEEANRKQEAAQNDTFFTQQHKNNWIQRAQQIRQRIQILTVRQRQIERAAQQTKAPAATVGPQPSATPHQ